MRTSSASTSTLAAEVDDEDATAPEFLAIHNCSRLGLRANPPRSWFANLFRPNRR